MNSKTRRKLQLTEFEILKDVVQMITANGLEYFLIGGTLLGAIKYKGFIPWDDDIDIAMPRAHYNKFLAICTQKLDKKYYLHCHKTDPQYWRSFMKIRLNNTIFEEEAVANINSHKGIYIDIFPLDNAKKQMSFAQNVQSYLIRCLTTVIMRRRGISVKYNKKLAVMFTTFISRIFSIKNLNKFQQYLMARNKNSKSKYFVNFSSHYDHISETILKEKFYPIKSAEFEGVNFSVPNDYDYILSRVYGDYTQTPAEEDRTTHNALHVEFGDNGTVRY